MVKKIFVGLIVLLTFYILSPFLAAIGMGAVFAVLFYPMMKRIERGRFPNALAAGLFTLAVTLLIFLPVLGMVLAGAKSGLNELQQIKRMNSAPGGTSSDEVLDKMFTSVGVDRAIEHASKVMPIDSVQVYDQLKELTANLAIRIGDALSTFISHVPNMLVAFSVFLFSLYYFLAGGLKFIYMIRQRSFFNEDDTARLIKTFSGLCRSVILASVISGGVQAAISMVVSFTIGIRQFPMVFLVIFIASFVPVLGSFPILIAMALYQFFAGNIASGIALVLTAILVSVVDHFIRPQVIRGSSNLHPLLAFASALGGLEILGISGVFLGPVICGLCVEMVTLGDEHPSLSSPEY